MNKIEALCVRIHPGYSGAVTKSVTDDLECTTIQYLSSQSCYSSTNRLHTRSQLVCSHVKTHDESRIGSNLPSRVLRTESVEVDTLPVIQMPPSSSVRKVLIPCLE